MIVLAEQTRVHRDDVPGLTQEETARVMTLRGYPMGKARVQQIEARAIEKLKLQFGEELVRLLAEV